MQSTSSYDLKIHCFLFAGYRRIHHSGGIGTYGSYIWLYPDIRSGIYMTVSGPGNTNRLYAMKSIVYKASDLLLGEKSWINKTTACSYDWGESHFEESNPDPSEMPPEASRPLRDYIGTFGNQAFGNITVYFANESLYLRLGQIGNIRLVPNARYNSFKGFYIGPLWYMSYSDDMNTSVEVTFIESAESGGVTELEFPVSGYSPPSRFVRDLKMTNNPPYNMGQTQCVSSAHIIYNGWTHRTEVVIIYILYLLSVV